MRFFWRMAARWWGIAPVAGLCLATGACATYYQLNQSFNREFEHGHMDRATAILEKNTREAQGKQRFLYFLNRATVANMVGDYQTSNAYFEKAYLFGEDYQINYLNEAATFLANPAFAVYKGEDHEHLMLLYYKAMNYLKMGDRAAALVECKRLNIRLNQLQDKYKSEQKYRRDAFIHNLMGIIYEASKDYNNAFIAYRNAYNIYEEDYLPMFGVGAPAPLKEDLLRTAYLVGFDQEYAFYKKQFGMEAYRYSPAEGGHLVFFWHNGLGPVKSEWGLNFAIVRGEGGYFNFMNDRQGFSFPFYLDEEEQDERDGLERMEFFRVAFPRYVERAPFYREGTVYAGQQAYPLALAQDVNAIAFKALRQRMVAEFSKSLLRAALKKLAEYQLRERQEGLGAALGLVNALTEKADTRNWQTIPNSIHYARIPLRKGRNEIKAEFSGNGGKQAKPLVFEGRKGETFFYTFSSLETQMAWQ